MVDISLSATRANGRLRRMAKFVEKARKHQQAKERLVRQRFSLAPPYVDAARRSLPDLSLFSQGKGIMLGLETRLYLSEIPNIDEMSELFEGPPQDLAGYWHDLGHAEAQQRLKFGHREEWLSPFGGRMVGVHLHHIRAFGNKSSPPRGNTGLA